MRNNKWKWIMMAYRHLTVIQDGHSNCQAFLTSSCSAWCLSRGREWSSRYRGMDGRLYPLSFGIMAKHLYVNFFGNVSKSRSIQRLYFEEIKNKGQLASRLETYSRWCSFSSGSFWEPRNPPLDLCHFATLLSAPHQKCVNIDLLLWRCFQLTSIVLSVS